LFGRVATCRMPALVSEYDRSGIDAVTDDPNAPTLPQRWAKLTCTASSEFSTCWNQLQSQTDRYGMNDRPLSSNICLRGKSNSGTGSSPRYAKITPQYSCTGYPAILIGLDRGCFSAGMSVHSPVPSYCQPWYMHRICSPWTTPVCRTVHR